MGWRGPQVAKPKMPTIIVMDLVFWDKAEVILMEFYREVSTLSGQLYASISEKNHKVYKDT